MTIWQKCPVSVSKSKCTLENDDVVDLYRKCYLSGPALFIIHYQGLEYGFAEDIMIEPRLTHWSLCTHKEEERSSGTLENRELCSLLYMLHAIKISTHWPSAENNKKKCIWPSSTQEII